MDELREKVRQDHEEQIREAHAVKILSACRKDESGNLVRAQLQMIKCFGCGSPRWEDGTRCPTCGSYSKALLNREDEGRY